MARVFIARDLETRAGSLVVDTVNQIAREAEVLAKEYAPPTKIWRTQKDAMVRPEHRPLEGAETIEGFRFRAKSFDWDRENRGVGNYTYLLGPRDRTSRSLIHVKNCRCYLEDGTGVADGIGRTPAVLRPTEVRATVVSSSEWARDAEFGTVYPNNQESRGAYYMARAAQAMKARLGIT